MIRNMVLREVDMFSLRDFVVFLAGVAFLHTISHLFLAYMVTLPMDFRFMVLTPGINTGAVIVSGIVTVVLIVIAARMAK